MPNYDFQCTVCGLAFKESLPFNSKGVPSCPKCEARSQKVIRPPMTIFKGSGFYKTDSTGKPVTIPSKPVKTPDVPAADTSDSQPLSTKTHTHSHVDNAQ